MSPRYVVTCLAHEDSVGGRGGVGSWTQRVGVDGAKRLGRGGSEFFSCSRIGS